MLRVAYGSILLALFAAGPAAASGSLQKPAPHVNPNAATIKEFLSRVDEYVALHKKLESTLPDLAKQTTPEAIDKHERALAVLIQEGRKSAKPGDLFTPGMQRLIRNLLRPIFQGRDGQQIKAEIFDNEYKGAVKLACNGRYPDEIPISTVPPQVLAQLPELPEKLEYRFIKNSLILFDTHAHIIADFVEQAFQ